MTEEKSATQVMACIFFGVAFGALIGSRLLEVSLWTAAIIGGMTGALIGVLVFAFEDIKRHAPVAWDRASGWRMPSRQAWKNFFLFLFAIFCFSCSLFVFFLLLAFIIPGDSDKINEALREGFFSWPLKELSQTYFYVIFLFFTVILNGFVFCVAFVGEKKSVVSKNFIRYANPIIVYGWYPIVALKYAFKALEWLGKRIPKFFCLIGRFLKQLGICIYSEALVLIFIHTFVGGAIGALVGSVLHILIIAALFSGLGGLQYQFISKPYFLKPAEA